MSTNNKHRKKNLLALFLSVLMVSSTAAAVSACSKNSATSSSTESESSTEESTTVKDDYIIKNAGFETFDTKDGLNAIGTTVTGWSRSTNSASSGSALTSKAASGILDTDAEAWKQLTGSYYEDPNTVETLTEAEAESVWDSLTVRDKLAYYEAWKDANDGTISEKLDFYQSFNIDIDDIPTPSIGNPGTHLKEGEEGYGEDTNILMIHNSYPDKDSSATYKTMGTAQKYSSSTTVTVPAGASAQFSVWVKTADLMSSSTSGASQEAVGKGAYISVTHSVGGTSLDAYQVKNINTQKMDEATLVNGWKEYTFYLQGSSYTSTTFSIVLGLGQGGGTDRLEYVNGYAFFDDITCEIITNDTYAELMQVAGKWDTANDAPLADATFITEKKDKTVDASKSAQDIFALDFYGKFNGAENILSALNGVSKAEMLTKDEKTGYTSVKGNNPAPWLGEGFDNSNDIASTLKINDLNIAGNKYATAVYEQLKDDEFVADETLLMLLSAQGAAYEAKSTQEIAFDADNKYIAVSFFVKTSAMEGFTGAGVTLVDGKAKTSFDAIDTTTISSVTIGEDEDVYNGWAQYFFFVENDSDKDDASFTLSFHFGPTAIDKGTTADSYHMGFAAFAKFETYKMSKQEFDSVSSDSYAKVVKVTANKADEAAGDSGFDSAAAVPTNAIEKGIANLQSYKGVYSDSAYVNATGSTEVNTNANAGLLSREYFADYYATTTGEWLNGLKAISGAATAEATWNSVFGYGDGMGSATQPLFIWNETAQDKAYGFIGKSSSIAADAYTAVSVRVKVGALNAADAANTFAYIYLIDTTDNTYGTPLSIGRGLTYWYDDDGNICTGDPAKKTTEIAFRLQSNGLYKASKTWSGYSKLSDADKTAYFANLDNYAKDEQTGNLLVADGGASHDYNDYWNNEGMDGVAFYYNKSNTTYYADKAQTVPVKALSTVTDLAPRYTAIDGAENQMVYKVGNTDGKWATVTFYIHAGNEAKNYRLEVWNGERKGAGNPASSYVIFDSNNPGTADSNFSSLIEDYEDKAQAKVEGVFSYFDSAKYLRYNAELDENKIGNLYKDSYVPSSYTEGVVYLAYADGLNYTAFADYSYSEITVAATVEDEDKEEDKKDETTDDGTNVWLLASSIILAAVLLLAIASIAIRKILKKHRKTRAPKVKEKKENTKKSKKD